MARDAGGTSIRLGERRQHVHRRCLARAVRPEQRDHLTATDLEADAAHGFHVAERLPEPLDDDALL